MNKHSIQPIRLAQHRFLRLAGHLRNLKQRPHFSLNIFWVRSLNWGDCSLNLGPSGFQICTLLLTNPQPKLPGLFIFSLPGTRDVLPSRVYFVLLALHVVQYASVYHAEPKVTLGMFGVPFPHWSQPLQRWNWRPSFPGLKTGLVSSCGGFHCRICYGVVLQVAFFRRFVFLFWKGNAHLTRIYPKIILVLWVSPPVLG